jgi:hypothetical protein
MTVKVTDLRVGDRVRVRWPGTMIDNVGTVFFAGRGYTSAKRDDGTTFRIKHAARIERLEPTPNPSRFSKDFAGPLACHCGGTYRGSGIPDWQNRVTCDKCGRHASR